MQEKQAQFFYLTKQIYEGKHLIGKMPIRLLLFSISKSAKQGVRRLMLEIMIVTHGKLSEGLKDAAEVIVGTSSHIETMCLESGEDIQTFGEKVKEN